MAMNEIGRMLIFTGVLLVVVGLFLTFGSSIPWLGRLPGDISFHRGNTRFYFPLATCVLLSILLSLILYFFRK